MNPISAAVLTSGLVTLANVMDKKTPITTKQAVGTGVYLLMLAGINESAPDIASKLALLVLLGVAFSRMPKIVKGLGWSR